jgi:hypothetical protein
MTLPSDRKDRSDERLSADIAEPAEANDPIEKTDADDPIEPMESAEPTDPMESTEPWLAMQRNESRLHNDQRERPEPLPSWPSQPSAAVPTISR